MRHADVALVQAAIVLAEEATAADRARFYALARRGRPQADADLVRTVDLRHRGQTYRLAVAQIALGRYRVTVDAEQIEVAIHRVGLHERRLEARGHAHRTLTSRPGRGPGRGGRRRAAPDRARRRRAGAQPRARRRGLDPGRRRRRGPRGRRRGGRRGDEDGELADRAVPWTRAAGARGRERARPRAGAARPDRAPRRRRAARQRRPRRVRVAATPSAAEGCLEQLRRLEWLVLGYDVGAGEVERIMADLHGACADPRDQGLRAGRRAPPAADVRRRAGGVAPSPRRGRPRDAVAAQPAGAPQRVAGLARRRGRQAPGRLHGPAARSARPLRDRRPRPHARARGGLLPPAPRPGARADRTRGRGGDPRPSPGAGRAARRAPRRWLPRGARSPGGGQRRPRSRRRGPRPRGALPLLRRARHRRRHRPRLRRDGAARRRPCRGPGAPGPRRSASRRSWRVHGRWPPLLTARMRGAEPALQRLLVEATARRYYRVRALEGLRVRAHRRP